MPGHYRAAYPLAGLLLAALLLAGCGGGQDSAERFLVAPGKYVLFNCPQIKQTADEKMKRQRELEALMVKAGNDTAGRMASAVAYRPEYVQLRGEMTDLRQAAVDKKCKFVPGAERAALPVGAAPLH